MPTLDVLGHPTWYTVRGTGDETVLLLHGGLSNSDALLDSVGGPLGERRRVAAFDRRGHGRTADTPEAFHYESMVDETIAVIEHIGGPVHIVALMAAAYAERSPDGPDHFAVVAAKGFHLFGIEPELTADDLAKVSVPVLVMAGDDDLVPLSHTAAFFAGLPEAQLAIVPGASHALPMEHPHEVVGLIERFLGSDVPPVTMMPNVRA